MTSNISFEVFGISVSQHLFATNDCKTGEHEVIKGCCGSIILKVDVIVVRCPFNAEYDIR